MTADPQPTHAEHAEEPSQQQEPEPSAASVPVQPQPPAVEASRVPVNRTRLHGLWVAIGCFTIVLVFLLIFIVQNDSKVNISYLGFHGQLTLGIAMLWSALAGVVLTSLAGTARIMQLRAAARRRARH